MRSEGGPGDRRERPRLRPLIRAFSEVRLLRTAVVRPGHAVRATELGALSGRVAVTGNLKFEIRDVSDSPKIVETAKTFALDSAPLVIAGSTTEGEEEMVLAAFEELRKEDVFWR